MMCHPRVPYLLAAATDFHHPTITALVHALKFEYISSAALPLARLTAEYLNTVLPEEPDIIIVPVPLSKPRLRKRGYNQSELIASHLARFLGMRLEPHALIRTKNSDPQSTMREISKRRQNVGGCFAVSNLKFVEYKNILLVDDVTTSGATFTECAHALKRAGARKIIAVAAAKA